ncbi:hypothetical protein [Salinisphaera sp. LB1]|uniref:hypothetical protein n=1 Tax=Salinisphaera sp. LB1 TaxID=2183911 RepID=UPI000D70698C|nr:hypothetical protein [Salinisphaera sp. LB1]AWN14702.1 hypothetical protein SALB1_0495 [Salinisphaera sp. LB1]
MIKRFCILGTLAIAALSFTGMAVAADNGGQSNSSQNNTQQLMKTYRSDAKQLKQIHDKTIKNNPQLAKEQQQFQQQVKGAIKKQGYDIKSGQKRMQSMAKKLQSGKLNDKQRKQVMQNFQNERQKMVKARNAALSQPAIKKSGQKLENDTIAAMKKQNPKTPQLISEMKSVRGKLQQQQQQQQSAGSNNGG